MTVSMTAPWKRDVALEMWVDVEHEPARIRLAGALDEATGSNLAAVVEELVDEGHSSLEINTDQLDQSAPGAATMLLGIGAMANRKGASLTWV